MAEDENTDTTEAAPDVPEGNPGSGRFAGYRTDLMQYAGGVHDSKAKATKAARDAGASAGAVEVIEV